MDKKMNDTICSTAISNNNICNNNDCNNDKLISWCIIFNINHIAFDIWSYCNFPKVLSYSSVNTNWRSRLWPYDQYNYNKNQQLIDNHNNNNNNVNNNTSSNILSTANINNTNGKQVKKRKYTTCYDALGIRKRKASKTPKPIIAPIVSATSNNKLFLSSLRSVHIKNVPKLTLTQLYPGQSQPIEQLFISMQNLTELTIQCEAFAKSYNYSLHYTRFSQMLRLISPNLTKLSIRNWFHEAWLLLSKYHFKFKSLKCIEFSCSDCVFTSCLYDSAPNMFSNVDTVSIIQPNKIYDGNVRQLSAFNNLTSLSIINVRLNYVSLAGISELTNLLHFTITHYNINHRAIASNTFKPIVLHSSLTHLHINQHLWSCIEPATQLDMHNRLIVHIIDPS